MGDTKTQQTKLVFVMSREKNIVVISGPVVSA